MVKLTRQDDTLARMLADIGYSFTRIGAILNCSDKTAKAASDRADIGATFSVEVLAQVENLLGFRRWLKQGDDAGYIESLIEYIASLKTYRGRDGTKAVRKDVR